MIVLGLCGSLRPGSYNLRLLEAAGAALAPDHRLVIFDGLAAVVPYVRRAGPRRAGAAHRQHERLEPAQRHHLPGPRSVAAVDRHRLRLPGPTGHVIL